MKAVLLLYPFNDWGDVLISSKGFLGLILSLFGELLIPLGEFYACLVVLLMKLSYFGPKS